MWWGSCPGGGGEDARALFSLRLRLRLVLPGRKEQWPDPLAVPPLSLSPYYFPGALGPSLVQLPLLLGCCLLKPLDKGLHHPLLSAKGLQRQSQPGSLVAWAFGGSSPQHWPGALCMCVWCIVGGPVDIRKGSLRRRER